MGTFKKKKTFALYLDKHSCYIMKVSNNKHDKVTSNTGNKHTGPAVTYRTSTCKDLSFKPNPRPLYLKVYCCWI